MKEEILDAIVVGAGHAGLSASYWLKQLGMRHFVFERGRIGESWISQRWDSFKMNTSNKLNRLPGMKVHDGDPDGFGSALEFVAALNHYVSEYHLPVEVNSRVEAIEKPSGSSYFIVRVLRNGVLRNFACAQVVIASGTMNETKIPPFAKKISKSILQFHASDYRNPSQLPDGAVLVAGSAQSGCQVAEDLALAGRKVFLATSMVPRIPRRYRGKDIMDWLIQMKFFELKKEEASDPASLNMKAPQLTGTDNGRRTISYQALAALGVTLLGRLEDADKHLFYFQANAAEHIQFADAFSAKCKSMIDEFVIKNYMDSPEAEPDQADMPDIHSACASTVRTMDAKEDMIRSVIWTCGFNGDFSYIKLPVLDEQGNPIHQNGVSQIKGLYFLGLPWLISRKSSIIFGVSEDAKFLIEKIRSAEKTVAPA